MSQSSAQNANHSQTSVYRQYTDPPRRPNDNVMPIYSAVYSGVNVYEMEVNGVTVMRRQADSWLNATQILKVAGVDKGRRTKVLEKEIQTGEHEKVQGGYGKYQGTWIPFDRGLEVCRQYGVEEFVTRLLTHNRGPDGAVGDVETPTKEQAMAAQRKRMYNTNSQVERSNGVGGGTTFFKNISSTASHAVAAISKARFDSPAPRNRNGPTRPPSFNRQPSMQDSNDYPANSQQSFASDYVQNGESAYGSQTTQPLNGDSLDQPPRKRQRVLTPANSFGGLTPTYPSMEAYSQAFPGSPTEPNESFIYSQAGLHTDGEPHYGPGPLRPLPYEVSPEAEAKRSMLMGLFVEPNGPDEATLKTLRNMIPQELDAPIDGQSHTALHWAATLARMQLLRALINVGASPFRVNAAGETALMRACMVTNSHDYTSFPELLDVLGGTIDVTDDRGRTVLHHIAVTSAVKGRSVASKYYLECLLEWVVRQGSGSNQSSQNVANSNGINPPAKMNIVRFMSEIVNAQDNSGDTALNIAARIGIRSIIHQLLEVGADPNIPNRAGLRPVDFGIGVETTDNANGDPAGERNSAAQGTSQKTRESSDEVVNSITRLISEASSVFQDELKRKQDSIDALHNNLRTTSAQVGEARRTLEALTEKLKAQQLARQKVANLSSASHEEEYRLVQLENAHGRLDIPSANAWELRLTEVLSALRQQGGTGPAAGELAGNLPDAAALRARIHALRNCSKQTKDAVAALQSQSKEKELKYRRLVSLCTRRPEVEVETLLETLTRAVESEKGELEITRVRRFLGGVEGVVH
ncbi:hypothetical protein B0T18DRAFT_327104 [Schizothecium vesticola]|uniref:Transcription factor SWI6 n=1 Tax=Schizothecium vesticola TaxID=314040 RepID=A0AA40EX13_9PEZI|nr:hypothetical protein B0T18DRAFT_327104 [Schizothecium vesticola]